MAGGVSRTCLAGFIIAALCGAHWGWQLLSVAVGVGALFLESALWLRWAREQA